MNYNKTSYLCVICGAVILAIGVLLLLSLDKNDNSLCEQQIEHAEFPVGINQGARDADRVVIAALRFSRPRAIHAPLLPLQLSARLRT